MIGVRRVMAATSPSSVTNTTQQTIDQLYDDHCDTCTWNSPTRVNDGQSTTFHSPKSLLGKVIDPLVQYWNGIVKPSGKYHMMDFTDYGNDVFNASQTDLMPYDIQKNIIPDTTLKEFCVTGRQCAINPETGAIILAKVTDTVWCTGDQPGKTQLISGLRALGGMMTRAYFTSNFQLQHEGVKRDSPPECQQGLFPGTNIVPVSLTFVDQNKYTNAVSQFVYTIESQTEEISVTVINGIKNVTHTFTNVEHTPGYNVMGGNNQHMTQTLCNSDGDDCNLASLAPITFLTTEQKQYIIDHTGGVWNTYKPAALAYNTKRDAIVQNQVFDVGVAGNGPIPADSEQFGDAAVYKSQTFGICTIVSAGDPRWLQYGCDKLDWRPASLTVPSIPPSVPDTSTWASTPGGSSANPVKPDFTPTIPIKAGDATKLVPACVLEGIAKIESDGQALCSPNECGAYGPFQITTGQCTSACHASSCPNAAKDLGVTKDALCDINSAAYQAARLLVGKANYWGTPISATASIQSQKAAIVNGADSYYGVGTPITRLGGLSYGEWVYQHCDPTETITHVDHKVGQYPGTPAPGSQI